MPLAIKSFLIIDNMSGHPQTISIEDEKVQVVLLSPNTTSMLQPLDQGTIRCVKASYTRQVFEMFRAAIDADPNLKAMNCCISFSIADAISSIKATTDEARNGQCMLEEFVD